jgi:hypothetical protein
MEPNNIKRSVPSKDLFILCGIYLSDSDDYF